MNEMPFCVVCGRQDKVADEQDVVMAAPRREEAPDQSVACKVGEGWMDGLVGVKPDLRVYWAEG